ncbi:CPBP family intramembrane glutamic endopeptidase [Secundilactobacillus kimchicus]|uniref:CPBP family intramembrane glutamic endopeptidase n=1 Tax=Secundilactobacillus kimchicus TaxID=528209 RepID=UPI0024A7D8B6|nr:type II CAAX endopeptidase family protein [Secundilactobacillus kimchicus]
MEPEIKSSRSLLTRLTFFVAGFVLIQCVQLWLLAMRAIKANQIGLQLTVSIAYLASFGLLIWLLVRVVSQERKAAIWHRISGLDVKLAVGGFVAFYVIEMGLGTLNQLLFNQQQTQNTQTINTLMGSSPWTFYLLAFSATFLSPVVEELLFRGYLFNAFFKKDQLWLPVVVSGVVFSLAHASSNPVSFLIYALLGAILMWVYRQTDNLATSISLHFLNNFIAMGLTVLNLNH